jgi:hypothetical protein
VPTYAALASLEGSILPARRGFGPCRGSRSRGLTSTSDTKSRRSRARILQIAAKFSHRDMTAATSRAQTLAARRLCLHCTGAIVQRVRESSPQVFFASTASVETLVHHSDAQLYFPTSFEAAEPEMSINSQLSVLMRSAAFVTVISTAACATKSNDSVSTGDVTAGLAATKKYACANCHQQDFAGSTTAYPMTTAYAANLTPDKDTGIGDWDADTIAKAILSGTDDENKSLCPTMSRFMTQGMTTTEAANIAAYLKSLPAVSKEIPESECSAGAAGSGSAGSSGAAGK